MSNSAQESRISNELANGTETNGSQNGNGSLVHRPRRRSTAKAMAAGQRDISVSEFFAKNRHLLGFDNPRKALLTTVKEAVDNSLDACEEAGILPEIWVHIELTGTNRFKVGIQDNGPGIVKKQIPLIFGKLLYGSKFHRLRMSRGQQGIGISAAGMYGVLTTGKPVKVLSKVSKRKPVHYYKIQIDTKQNKPEILNGKGDGVDIPAGEAGRQYIEKNGIEWTEVDSGTRVTIELEARYQRGKGSVDEYLEQTAVVNPHTQIHYTDPDGNTTTYSRSAEDLPPEPKEIKPHPYGVEIGMMVSLIKESGPMSVSKFLSTNFSRTSTGVARRICETAKVSTRVNIKGISREDVEQIYAAIQETRIPAPATDCVVPIGEELLLKGLRHVVPGEFYAAATRPPAVYRGNPFLIEVALAYGGASPVQRVSRELLRELISQSDARTIRQFLTISFSGLGIGAADRIISEAKLSRRASAAKLSSKELDRLHAAMGSVNLDEGQTMNLFRYANRVPLQFQQGACAITQTVSSTNWRAYGLTQSRGSLPSGPITVLVHMASVWVPFTSESKEAIAGYPEIQKEIRLGLQSVGRKLGMFLRRRLKVRQEGERRNIFLRYLKEVASAASELSGKDRDELYENLVKLAKRKTADADTDLGEDGRPVDVPADEYGGGVLIVPPEEALTVEPGKP